MLKISRQLFFQEKSLQNSNKGSLDTAQRGGIFEDEMPLTSLKDIEWVTNVIEPEQQRGPSENP